MTKVIKMDEKFDKVIQNSFVNNTKHEFKVKYLKSIKSYLVYGNIDLTIKMIKLLFGSSLKLFGDYGYTIKTYPVSQVVLIKNFSAYSNYKWNKIWSS